MRIPRELEDMSLSVLFTNPMFIWKIQKILSGALCSESRTFRASINFSSVCFQTPDWWFVYTVYNKTVTWCAFRLIPRSRFRTAVKSITSRKEFWRNYSVSTVQHEHFQSECWNVSSFTVNSKCHPVNLTAFNDYQMCNQWSFVNRNDLSEKIQNNKLFYFQILMTRIHYCMALKDDKLVKQLGYTNCLIRPSAPTTVMTPTYTVVTYLSIHLNRTNACSCTCIPSS